LGLNLGLQPVAGHDGFLDLFPALEILLVDIQHKMVPGPVGSPRGNVRPSVVYTGKKNKHINITLVGGFNHLEKY